MLPTYHESFVKSIILFIIVFIGTILSRHVMHIFLSSNSNLIHELWK